MAVCSSLVRVCSMCSRSRHVGQRLSAELVTMATPAAAVSLMCRLARPTEAAPTLRVRLRSYHSARAALGRTQRRPGLSHCRAPGREALAAMLRLQPSPLN